MEMRPQRPVTPVILAGEHAWFALHRIKFQRPQNGQPVFSYCPECSANRPVSIGDPELIERRNLT